MSRKLISTAMAAVVLIATSACVPPPMVCRTCNLLPGGSYLLVYGETLRGVTADSNGCVSYLCSSPPNGIIDSMGQQVPTES